MHKSHTIYAEDKNDNQIMQLAEERCAIIFQSTRDDIEYHRIIE